MRTLQVTVPGRAVTAHRGARKGRRQLISYPNPKYDAWKAHVRRCAAEVVPDDWPMHALGPRGGKLPMLYAVNVCGFASDGGYDADNLRGVLDACEGVLWSNDRSCKPVTYDCVTGAGADFVRFEVVPWDPREGLMLARFEWREAGET